MQLVRDYKYNGKNFSFWLKWLCSIIFISFFFIATIDSTPYLHKDEPTTIELGRNTLQPDSDWSIAWLTLKKQPVFTWFYIGPVLQELTYHIFGEYGPRVMSLFGALVAATAAVGWLLACGIKRYVAFLLGIIFLLDPLIVQSYTIARIDCWAIALCFFACWILRSNKTSLKWNGKIVVAGLLMTLSFFIWPSALFLFPLVILELISLVKDKGTANEPRGLFKTMVILISTCFIATILILIPVAPVAFSSMNNVIEGLRLNLISGPNSSENAGPPDIYTNSVEILRSLKFSPFLPIIALFTIIVRKELGLLIAGMTIVVLLVLTVVYINRVLYMIPYFVFVVAYLYPARQPESFKPIKKSVLNGFLAVLLVWCVGLTLIARTVLAFDNKEERERGQISVAAQQLIGKGDHHVFLCASEFYYAGRNLGWKMYTPYLAFGDVLTFKTIKIVLPTVDYFLMMERQMTAEFAAGLEEAGMHDQGVYSLYADTYHDDFKTDNIRRLRNLYHIYIKPYGPYRLYVRHQKPLITTLHKK
ncbi:ArnT family glycosyltransferase [Pedobacter immunditicola]|uniref:ArnT family glycosyltransferase n=1 Tax=Pedobacter immunditicola TaxID=3133440 RepID=UPI0030A2CC60